MKRIELPQGPVHYADVGDGPPVVFVHGLLVDHRLWSPAIERLATGHRCIAPDWPLGSHREPMNPDADLSPAGMARLVADFLEALDLRDVTLVGNDSGGAISQLVAADHGERVGRLVLTNCDALEAFPPPGFGYLAWLPRIPGAMWLTAKLLARSARVRRLPMAYGALTCEPIADELLRAWVEPAATDPRIRRDAGKFTAAVSCRITREVAGRLERFAKPALLSWGERDPYFPVELARRLLAHLPDGRLELIPEATVFVPLDRPDAVADGIARLVAEAGGAARENRVTR